MTNLRLVDPYETLDTWRAQRQAELEAREAEERQRHRIWMMFCVVAPISAPFIAWLFNKMLAQ